MDVFKRIEEAFDVKCVGFHHVARKGDTLEVATYLAHRCRDGRYRGSNADPLVTFRMGVNPLSNIIMEEESYD